MRTRRRAQIDDFSFSFVFLCCSSIFFKFNIVEYECGKSILGKSICINKRETQTFLTSRNKFCRSHNCQVYVKLLQLRNYKAFTCFREMCV